MPVASDLRLGEEERHIGAMDIATETRLQREWGITRFRPIGMHVVLPGGRLVASEPCPNESAGVLRFLSAALRGNSAATPREVARTTIAPSRGSGFLSDGSARLAVTIRVMDHGRAVNDRPVLDSIVLTKDEIRAMAPPQAQQGLRYAIPAVAGRQFLRAFTDTPDSAYALRPQDATDAHLEGTVVSVSGDATLVQIEGTLAGERTIGGVPKPVESHGTAVGLLTFSAAGKLRRLQVVCSGDYFFPWAKASYPVGGLVEWRAE